MEVLSLGEKIKLKRKAQNLTLKDLAGDRVTPGQISLVESGKSNPSMDLLQYLSAELGVSIEYLVETEKTQATRISEYYYNMAKSCLLKEDLYLAEVFIGKSIHYANEYDLIDKKAKNHFINGYIYSKKGQLSKAQKEFIAANEFFIINGDYVNVADTLKHLGIVAIEFNSHEAANSYFEQAEEVALNNDISDDSLIGEIYYQRANICNKLGDIQKSIRYCKLAQEKFQKINDKREYGKSLLLLAQTHGENGEIEKAKEYSEKSVAVFKSIDEERYISIIENNIGKLFSEVGNIEEAFIHFNKAKDIRERTQDNDVSEVLANICESYIKIKDIEKAKQVLSELYEKATRESQDNLVDYYLLKYTIDVLEDNIAYAEDDLLKAYKIAEDLELHKEKAEIVIKLGKHYLEYGDEKQAATYLDLGVTLLKETGRK